MNDIQRIAEACFHTFESDVGKVFLQYLVDTYFNQRVYQPGMGMTFDQVAYAEGKRHVVDEILALRQMYLTGETPPESYPEEEETDG